MKSKPSDLPRTVRTRGNIVSVKRVVLDSPQRSTRPPAPALRTSMSRRLLQRILHDDLLFHPYKIMIVRELTERDFVQRREFCARMRSIFAVDPDVVIMMSDETHFHLI